MSRRIEVLAEMVNEGAVVADIGTDHAFLPILLRRSGRAEKVYACDVRSGPLLAAKKNIEKAKVSGIETILSDGFANVPADAKTAVIAGMGYFTAVKILEDASARLGDFDQIIVEVNREEERMRSWISEHCFTILDERCVYEKGFDYVCISFAALQHAPYSREEILLGPMLLKKKEAAFLAMCERKRQLILDILSRRTRQDETTQALQEKLAIYSKIKT